MKARTKIVLVVLFGAGIAGAVVVNGQVRRERAKVAEDVRRVCAKAKDTRFHIEQALRLADPASRDAFDFREQLRIVAATERELGCLGVEARR